MILHILRWFTFSGAAMLAVSMCLLLLSGHHTTTSNALLTPTTCTCTHSRINTSAAIAIGRIQNPSTSTSTSTNPTFSSFPNTFVLTMAATPSAISSLTPLTLLDGDIVDIVDRKEADDEETIRERLAGKSVALYFSAGWCPMCTSFEPALQAFQQAANDSGKPVEIIYVPSDKSQSDAIQRAKAMGMVGVIPMDRAGMYKKSFGVWAGSEAFTFGFGGRRSGVPALVVLDPTDGTEMAFIAAESKGPKALGSWPLGDGIW